MIDDGISNEGMNSWSAKINGDSWTMEKTLGYNEVTWSLGFIQEKWTFSQQTILVGGCIPTPLKNIHQLG